jgi:hypothetical protein
MAFHRSDKNLLSQKTDSGRRLRSQRSRGQHPTYRVRRNTYNSLVREYCSEKGEAHSKVLNTVNIMITKKLSASNACWDLRKDRYMTSIVLLNVHA